MATKRIPDEVKAQVNEIVARFNERINDPMCYLCICYYAARFRGPYLYLDRSNFGQVGPIYRLKYTGDMDNWVSGVSLSELTCRAGLCSLVDSLTGRYRMCGMGVFQLAGEAGSVPS
jgi:hypothetical protein